MSGGKKQTYAHKYYAGWQKRCCPCWVLSSSHLGREDKEAWYGGMGNGSSRIAQQNLFGGTNVGGGGGVTGNFNYYSGSPNQMPDPYLEKVRCGECTSFTRCLFICMEAGVFRNIQLYEGLKFRLSYVNGIKPTFIDGVTNIVIAMDSSRSMTEEDFLFFTTSGAARMIGLIGDLVAVYDGSIINLRLMFFDASLHIKDYIGFTEEDVPDAIAWINAKRQVSGASIFAV